MKNDFKLWKFWGMVMPRSGLLVIHLTSILSSPAPFQVLCCALETWRWIGLSSEFPEETDTYMSVTSEGRISYRVCEATENGLEREFSIIAIFCNQ